MRRRRGVQLPVLPAGNWARLHCCVIRRFCDVASTRFIATQPTFRGAAVQCASSRDDLLSLSDGGQSVLPMDAVSHPRRSAQPVTL